VTFEPLSWRPTSYDQAQSDIDGMPIRETHFLELKSLFNTGAEGTGKLYKALASLANYGGVLVIGVEEDRALQRAKTLAPVKLAGQVDRVMQFAANLDPPLALPTPLLLEDPADPTQGLVVVTVPASPMAPHRTPNNGYFSRDTRAYPMPDAEAERLIRLRRDRTVLVESGLEAHIKAVSHVLIPRVTMNHPAQSVAWFAFAMDPAPSHLPFLLRSRLTAEARPWLEAHMKAAQAKVEVMIAANPRLAGTVANNYSLFWSKPRAVRIDGGVRFSSQGSTDEQPPKASTIEVFETGAIRLSENYLNFTTRRGVLHWQSLLGAAAWAMGLFHSIHKEAGPATGAHMAVRVGRIKGMIPDINFGDPEDIRQRERNQWTPDPYPAAEYEATRTLSGSELSGDPSHALDWLFGQFLRNMSLPDLLYLPPR
jgi:hypothetical protein